MRVGLVGLGRMGRELALQAIERGQQMVGPNRSREKLEELAALGVEPAWPLSEAVAGSVIRGWLIDLMERGEKEPWIPVIAQAELAFYRCRDPDSISGKAVALLRHGFGRHPLHSRRRGGEA